VGLSALSLVCRARFAFIRNLVPKWPCVSFSGSMQHQYATILAERALPHEHEAPMLFVVFDAFG
jgi:hypothetical protein